jgi:alpha-tubulin suppressor-like RCC1 family protein
VQIATKIILPVLREEDEIEKIECGWKNSAILTKSGKVFITETQVKQKVE